MLRNTLKVHRAIHNLTQAELAERIHVSRKSINAIETGNMVPSIVLALKLAAALQVSVHALFQWDEAEPSADSQDI